MVYRYVEREGAESTPVTIFFLRGEERAKAYVGG
jgi:hypothetical protein